MSKYLFTNNDILVPITSGIEFTRKFDFGTFIASYTNYVVSMINTICDIICLHKYSFSNNYIVSYTEIGDRVICCDYMYLLLRDKLNIMDVCCSINDVKQMEFQILFNYKVNGPSIKINMKHFRNVYKFQMVFIDNIQCLVLMNNSRS